MEKIILSEIISNTNGVNIIKIRIPTNEQLAKWGADSSFAKAEIRIRGNIVWQGFPGDSLQFYAESPTSIALHCGELIITGDLYPGKSYECTYAEKDIKAVP